MPPSATHPTPLLRIRPSRGLGSIGLRDVREIWEFRDLLIVLASRDLKLRYKQTFLGVAWVIFQPLLAAGIFSLVFGVMAKFPSEGVPYFVFAFAGQLGWSVFSSTFSKASGAMVGNAQLVSKVYFPRILLPASTMLSTLVDLAVGLVVLGILMVINGIALTPALALLPLWILLLLLLALGLGLMAAALVVSYRDVQYVLPVLVPLLMYASPVAYSLSVVPAQWRWIWTINPLSALLEGFRWSVLGRGSISPLSVIASAMACVAVLILGAGVFKRMERRFADVI
ncbi:MAG: ABC transporter permease [Tepidisphaeraceae bacterium]